MPLDKEKGEVLDGLEGKPYVVIPHAALADMTQVLVPYLKPGKFRPKEALRPLFEDAMANARERFAEAGALLPIAMDESAILCQLYPEHGKVAVVVARLIAGAEHFVVRDYELPKPVIKVLLGQSDKRSIRAH